MMPVYLAQSVFALAVVGSITTSVASAQSFSCPIGREPACLDYGDRVVDQSAACFDTLQCDYEGFTCKSHVTSCAADYEALLQKHNALVDDYNALLEASQARETAAGDLRDCLYRAETNDDVRRCTNR